MLMLDTSAYSAAARGRDDARELVQGAERLLMCPVAIAELIAGFRRGSRETENRGVLDEFLSSPRVIETAITYNTAEFYAILFSDLRSRGTPVPTSDIWIAASAMEHGAHLATADAHFRKIPGLVLHFLSD